jgi:hypothetical protein
MNLFKKALVATAVVASFGASATATVSSTALQLSAEGIADGVTATAQPLTFDIVVGTDTPAASTITLTFDNTIDLAGISDGAVTNAPGAGTGIIGTGTNAGVQFDYGTGSFTFDNVVVTDNDQSKGEQDTFAFDVNLGNALTAGSAFRITLGNNGATPAVVGVTTISGATNLSYVATAADDSVIETGSGTVAEETAQFAFVVDSAFSSLIDRDVLTDFTDGDDTETATWEYTNNEDLAAALVAPALTVVVEGNFTGLLTTADFDVTTSAAGTATAPVTALTNALNATVNSGGDSDELTVALIAANASVDGTTDIDVTFDGVTAANIPVTGALEADASIIATNGDSAGTAISIATNVGAGEWKIDATIINVPYLPVGFEGTSSSVHLSNEGATSVDVRVSANSTVDSEGDAVVYPEVDLGFDLTGKSVTKVTQGMLMELLGAPAGSKLSVTFNIDANEGVVNGYAFTTDDTGRTEVSTSQQRGN